VIDGIDGVAVGHWSDPVALTGCTVVVFDPAVVASGEVRGGAPASHEFALLDPASTVPTIDAVVLSGGSAFGLAAAVGVTGVLEEHDRGLPTMAGRVPIVVGLSLFDLAVGDASVRPGVEQGRIAAAEAIAGAGAGSAVGRIGAGTGATASKWRGIERAVPGGLVGALRRDGDLVVAALVAANPWGDVHGAGYDDEPWPELPPPGDTGLERTADSTGAAGPGAAGPGAAGLGAAGSGATTNTTIGVVVTNARLDKLGCHHVARGAHDGLARAITPAHSRVDGDAFVAAATGAVDATVERVRAHTVEVVDRAIRQVAAMADLAPGDRLVP